MNLSPAHAAARAAAARLPALQASLALLDSGAGTASIVIYSGVSPAGDLLATIPLADGVGHIDESAFKIILTAPMEGQVTTSGTAAWARIVDNMGVWWADVSLSDADGSGEIKLESLALTPGVFVRLTSAAFQG